MIIVLDNAAYHHARSLRPLPQKHRRHLGLFFLPPYSPQLSTIERD
jgi:transposase